MIRKDKYDNSEFIPSRSNQYFKNRSNQIAYNNAKAKSKRKSKYFIDKTLNTNREKMLELLNGKEEILVSTNALKEKGINTDYHTHSKRTPKGICWCVYEIEMYLINDDQVKLVNTCANQNS